MWALILRNPVWVVAVLLGVPCLLLFGQWKYQSARADQAVFQARLATSNYETAQAANKNLKAALQTVSQAHDALVQMMETDREEMERAVETMASYKIAITQAQEELKAHRQELLHATPTCAELARLDITAACPALADSLRNEAGRH